VQRPTLSISREDGIVLSGSARQRWRQGTSGLSTRTFVGTTSAYKSLNLPGFAHHVVAARAAAGYADSRAISNLSVGGINGASLDVIAGYGIGGSSRTFGVRGFSPSAERGIRAFAGSVEYRFPLAAPGRGIGWVPLFLDRVSGDLFGDAGRAYCPATAVATSEACESRDVGNPWIGSVGGELNLDAGIQRDFPFRLRLGIAQRVAKGRFGESGPSFYVTAGSSF
jgi:outer membrane protein assembly factor BamA